MRITMPQLGESVVEGTISRWLKQPGEQIEQYEPLLEIVTDKVNAEYPSPVSGTLAEILVPEGETVPVHHEIAEINVAGETADSQGAQQAMQTTQPNEQTITEQAVTAEVQTAIEVQQVQQQAGGSADGEKDQSGRRYSPAVRRLAEEHGINLSQVQGSGAGGRVTKQDVEAVIEKLMAAPPIAVQPAPEPQAAPQAQPASAASPRPQPAAPAHPGLDGDQLQPLTPMRRAIAEHMVRSVHTSPHATTVMEVDMTAVARYREQQKAAFAAREGFSLTFLPFVIRAVVESLQEHPILNSSWSDDGILLHRQINIGVAVALEDGLIVPVIHNADEKSLVGLARAVNDLASRARSNRLSPQDVQGGTFTVNNPGTFGTLMSTPIISQPQAAILSTEAVVKRPVVVDDAIAIRSMMYISLSIDHRVLDGLQAGRFLQTVRRRLEGFTPESAGL